MSKFYQVRSAQTVYSKITVQANSEEEAQALAVESMNWREYDAQDFIILEINEEMRDE